jgi:hypothetical protein
MVDRSPRMIDGFWGNTDVPSPFMTALAGRYACRTRPLAWL